MIHMQVPAFLTDENGDPMPYDRSDQAEDAANGNRACQVYGRTIIRWAEIEGIKWTSRSINR